MTPVTCRVPHKPDEGKFGDCMRACVATILDLDASEVPHFAEDNPDGASMFARIEAFLMLRNLTPVYTAFDANVNFDEFMAATNVIVKAHCILFCSSGESDHAVVIKGGKVVHDPSWGGRKSTYPPMASNHYALLIIGALV